MMFLAAALSPPAVKKADDFEMPSSLLMLHRRIDRNDRERFDTTIIGEEGDSEQHCHAIQSLHRRRGDGRLAFCCYCISQIGFTRKHQGETKAINKTSAILFTRDLFLKRRLDYVRMRNKEDLRASTLCSSPVFGCEKLRTK
jgi:hypothetical protein